jgi:alpha-D-ribose 1-methylphosphonate 5-triphosphate synthase subunit PhnL
LPVLIVNDWKDITQDLLDNYKPDNSNIKKIHMDYWINLFNMYKK